MRKSIFLLQFSTAFILSGFYISSFAGLISFTSDTAFNTAISGYSANTLNFDAQAANSTIADGASLDGITFNYPVLSGFGVSAQIRNDGDTTSAANFLGTDDSGVFQDSDDLNLGFSAVNAIGMYFLSGDTLFDGDIRLSVGATSFGLVAADLINTLADGTFVYFMGFVDELDTFTSLDILTSHDGTDVFFSWNIDDITTANTPVPEPGILLLFTLGLFGLQRIISKK